jgi:hypothetical protein
MTDPIAPTTVLEAAIRDFKRSIEITRDVRFQASAYIVSLLSLYVIGLSLIPNILTLQPFQSQTLLACSVVLSVFVIFTSLIDGSQNFFHQGELLHQCARKIAAIHHELKLLDPLGDAAKARADFDILQKRYREALDECPINHDNVDYYREIATKPHLFPDQYRGHWQGWYTKWNRFLSVTIGYSWMLLHLIAIGAISFIVYVTIFRETITLVK